MSHVPHLRQMEEAAVNDLCARALNLGLSHGIKLEVYGFKESRTPWDATRLANALAMNGAVSIDCLRLIAGLDRAAEACAGAVLPNKGRRPAEDPPYDGVMG